MKSLVNQWHHSSSYLAIASVCLSTTDRAQQWLQYCEAGIDVNLHEWSDMERYVYWKIDTKCELTETKKGVPEEVAERILKDRQDKYFLFQTGSCLWGRSIQVGQAFLFLSTGVPHSHIMRQSQQGVTNVVGKSPQDGEPELQFQPQQRKARAIKKAYPNIILTICCHDLMMNMNFIQHSSEYYEQWAYRQLQRHIQIQSVMVEKVLKTFKHI